MKKKRFSTRFWVILIALVLAASAAAAVLLHVFASGTVANVYLNGECIRSIDLSTVTEDYTFTVEGDACTNVVEVAPGKIRVQSADCPDQVCVNTGWITDSSTPIVCLPNKLVIRIESDAGSSSVDVVAK